MNFIRRCFCVIILTFITMGFSPSPVQAHGFQTAYLELREQSSGQIHVLWKTPSAFGSGDDGYGSPIAIRPVFPKHCTVAITPGALLLNYL